MTKHISEKQHRSLPGLMHKRLSALLPNFRYNFFFCKMWLLLECYETELGVSCEVLVPAGFLLPVQPLWKQRICSWAKSWYEVHKKAVLEGVCKCTLHHPKISNGDVVGQVLKNLLTSGPLSMSLPRRFVTLRWQCDVWSGWWRPPSVPASTTTTTRMGLV